jgi:hypothetical protein
MTCTVMFGALIMLSRCSSWLRIASRPPIGRRSAASSSTAHSRTGTGPGRARICCRCLRRLTRRSTSSGGSLPWLSLTTARV